MQANKKIHACPFAGCTYTFNRPYRLAQHRLVHINVKPFACQEKNCSKSYTNKSHLDRHMNSAHKKTELDILYCCPICMKNYANRQNLKRHMKRNHSDNKNTYKCDYCSALFHKKHQIKAHMYQHTGVKAFRCCLCLREHVTISEKNKHMKNHKVYTCEHCDSKFNRWSDMLLHRKNNHQSSEFICNECGKVFKDRSYIIRHVKIHMAIPAVPVYFCPYENCQRHYSRNNNLKQHILLKHEGLKFECPLCRAQLSTKAKLNEHIVRHAKPKVILRIPKTRENGRKRRKDVNSMRVTSALKLAGMINEENIFKKISEDNSTDNNNLYYDLQRTYFND